MQTNFADFIRDTGEVLRGERDNIIEEVYKYIESGRFDLEWHGPRADGYHPSSAFWLCPRKTLYSRIIPKKALPDFGLDMLLRFNHGHAIHWWFQHRLLGPLGFLLGRWKCLRCGAEYQGRMPRNCNCGADRECLSFKERPLAKGLFIGHIDGETELSNGPAIVEIKSTQKRLTTIDSPLDYNFYQANIYMWMAGISQTLFMYVSKMESFRVKPILVEFNEDLLEDALKRVKENELVVNLSDDAANGCNPKDVMGICDSMGAAPASKCSWSYECFDVKF